MADFSLDATEQVTLCEALDRILNKGAVVFGEAKISVANIDLIYLGLRLVVTSVEAAPEITDPETCSRHSLRVGLGIDAEAEAMTDE